MQTLSHNKTSKHGPGFILAFVAIYVAFSPFYLLPSGMPQFADMILAVTALIYFVRETLQTNGIRITQIHFIGLLFAAYTCLINAIYWTFLQDMRFLLGSMYYVYNVIVFIMFSSIIKKYPEQSLRWIYLATCAAILIQTIILTINPDLQGFRATGTFVNPNQLAFWSWYCAAILVILKIRKGLAIYDFALLFCVGYMQTLSLSKAGIICFLLIICSLPFSGALTRQYKALYLFVAFFFVFLSLFSLPTLLEKMRDFERIDSAISRLENIGHESDDSAHGRGYTRILQNPSYLVTGAGEGGYWRFHDTHKPLELHSALGTLVFSYGIVGTSLFFLLLYGVQKGNYSYILILFGLVLVYGIVHQNIRFTHFWVFLGICEGLRHLYKADKQEHKKIYEGLATT